MGGHLLSRMLMEMMMMMLLMEMMMLMMGNTSSLEGSMMYQKLGLRGQNRPKTKFNLAKGREFQLYAIPQKN